MVLPIYKVLSLVIRVFSKPLVTYIKQAHLKNDSHSSYPMLRKMFIGLGNTYNRAETWVNRKFMKIETQFAYKQLNDQLAIQKGIQFFYQIFFYSLVIGLPLYEMLRQSNQAKAKSKALDDKLHKIDEQLQQILSKQKEKQKIKQAKSLEPISKEELITHQVKQVNTQATQKINSNKLVESNQNKNNPTHNYQFYSSMYRAHPLHSIRLHMPNNTTHIYDIFFTKSNLDLNPQLKD